MKIGFFGAAGTVTGSQFLLTSDKASVLVDCGLFQGTQDIEALNKSRFLFDPTKVKALLLTHAHLDHCGRIPQLVAAGFSGHIYATRATHELLKLSLTDAAHVMSEKQEKIYDISDVEKTISLVKLVEYHKPIFIDDLEIEYVNAGHILGSASIKIFYQGKTIAFSGDLGNSPQDLIKPTEYINNSDFVVCESTYGDRIHEKANPKEIFEREIAEIKKSGGTLLVPAFSLERTQEILHILDHIKKEGKMDSSIQVFLDSPMAIKATAVFREFVDLYNFELKSHEKLDDPFSFEGLTVVFHSHESEKIKEKLGPKIIIAGSGMMTGGRILSHAKYFLPMPSSRILFVGYQAEGTPGRKILDGARLVKIEGEDVEINASVSETQAMSSHADQSGILKWIGKTGNPKGVFLVHGENPQREALKKILVNDLKLAVETPSLGESFDV